MVIGWIAGGVGVVGLVLALVGWRGTVVQRDDTGGKVRRKRWFVLGGGLLIAAAGSTAVAVPGMRQTPLLRAMPTDVLIAGASVVPRSWLLDPVSFSDTLMGRTAGDALNRRMLTDAQKLRLTRRIDGMLAEQESLEEFARLAQARPRWRHEGVPLSDEARLVLLELLARQMETDPEYDVSESDDVLRGLDNAIGGFGTVAADGFRKPTPVEAVVLDRFLSAAASFPIDDGGVGSVAAAMPATYMQVFGPWFPTGTPLLLRWANEQEMGFAKRSQRAAAAIASITLAGVWDEEYRDRAAGLMRSENEAVAFSACLLRIHDDELAQVYRPILLDIARTDHREYVFLGAVNSLLQMEPHDRELYELLKGRFTTAVETRGQIVRSAMRFPASMVRPDVELYLDMTAQAEGKHQAQMASGMMYLHRTLEDVDAVAAEHVLEAGRRYAVSEDEHVSMSAFWAEE